MAITLYPQDCEDFSTNGLGVLTPLSCTVTEESCGMFELELEQPIDPVGSRALAPGAASFELRWAQIQPGCIVKAPVPMRESPLYEIDIQHSGEYLPNGYVTRNVLEVTGTKSGLALYNKPSGKKKKLAKLKNGARVNEIGERSVSGALWKNVIAQNGGKQGWMKAAYLAEAGTVEENVWNGQIVHPAGIRREQCREQLFRIHSVERDAERGVVTAKAMHISYDLRATLVNSDYKVEKKTPAKEVLAGVFSRLATEHAFELHVLDRDYIILDGTPHANLSVKITGDYSWKNPIECMLDPDDGILAQARALLLRDNYDLYVLCDQPRDSGVTIRRGKNLKAVSVTQDVTNIVTRIIPVGKAKDGKDLFLEGANYVDSPRIGDYPLPYVKKIDYDVKVVDKDADNDTSFKSAADARKKLKELAEADFAENGVDLPGYGMEVDFVLLQNTAEYADYAALQAVYLNDTVTVIDSRIGLTAKLRVTGYEWDAIRCQYGKVTLGDIESLEQTVYSYNLPNGGVSGSKIAPGSLPGAALRDATIEYAKIGVAAIEQLTADSVVALTAKIREIVAQQLTTDELYAALAALNRAVIEHADIAWANIESLKAAVAELAKASIGTADIGWGQIKDLISGTAIITEGEAGQLFIARLSVTEANLVSLTTGELIVKGADGRFYALTVDEGGEIRAELKQVSNDDVTDLSIDDGRVILETDITATNLNTSNLFATFALVNRIDAARIDVDALFAREAFITLLRTCRIVGDRSLELIAQDAEAGAGAAQDAATALDAANQALTNQGDFVTRQEQATYMRVSSPGGAEDAGVYIGLMTNGQRPAAEAFIDATGWFRVLNNGASITSLGPKIQELGSLTIYETAEGGHAFL